MAKAVSNILLEKDILLESGTNELEILVFRLADYTFGINVAKVREVFPLPEITVLPKAHSSILGVFRLRDAVIPCVSLRKHLQVTEPTIEKTLILAELNQQQTAFVVDAVERIHRLSWEKVLSMPALGDFQNTPVTSIAKIDERLIIMLDFEMINAQVTDSLHSATAIANTQNVPRNQMRILVADDSPTVRRAMASTLEASGYTNVQMFENGKLAWEHIEEKFRATGSLAAVGDLLVSDIEMPQMDGLHLTKRIKENANLKALPVLLYSSIVTPDNQKKGQAVGANAQISKPELHRIVEWADKLILESKGNKRPTLPASRPADPSVAERRTPPPAKTPSVAPVLLTTFRTELADYVSQLKKLADDSSTDQATGDVCNSLFRIVHSIKSAAAVIPLTGVCEMAHQVEDLLEQVRQGKRRLPWAAIQVFTDWLADLTTTYDLSAVLAQAPLLTDDIATAAQ